MQQLKELYFQNPSRQKHVEKILEKVSKTDSSILKKNSPIISFNQLRHLLTSEEDEIVQYILTVDPRDFGFKGKYLGIVDVPKDIVTISGQEITVEDKTRLLADQFVPRNVYEGYLLLNKQIFKDLGRILLVESAYRSPAYQVLTMLHYLKMYGFDLEQTAKRVAFPGCSEHGYPPNQAIDFMNVDGKPTDDSPLDFEDTEEFTWLVKNAGNFGFVLSYPKDNPDGIMYEPWHWRYER